MPGTALNGSLEDGEAGWTFEVDAEPAQGLAEGGIESGIGRDGTRGARIFEEIAGINAALMKTLVSVPTLEAELVPALRFWWKSTSGAQHWVELQPLGADRLLDVLVGDGEWHQHTYCLPPWMHGVVVEPTFSLRTSEADAELVVDDLEVVSANECGTGSALLDPGFESAPRIRPGLRESGAGDSVAVIDDPGEARTGDGVLEIRYTDNLQRSRVDLWVLIPPSDEIGGPELRFYSKVPDEPGLPIDWVLGRAAEKRGAIEAAPDGDWALEEACLPPDWSGRWFRFQIRVGPKRLEDPLAFFDPPNRVLLDDFSLRTSPNCPSTP
jgi:hypothetical protein